MSDEQDQANQQQLHKLYQSLPKDMPPPELDARILDAAHQAVAAARPRVTNIYRRRQSQYAWLKPLAYAAVLVLCLGVVLRIQIDQQTVTPQSVAPVAVEAESANEMRPVPVMAPTQSLMTPKPEAAAGRTDEMKASRLRVQAAGTGRQADEMFVQMKKEADIQQPAALSINHAADTAAVPLSAAESTMQFGVDEDAERAVTALLKLYQDKEFDQLAVQLKAFMVKYPGYALPEELNQFAREKL